MDCCNFTKKGNNFLFHSLEYEHFRDAKNKGLIMHYVPKEHSVKFEIVMDDSSKLNGFAESSIINLKVDSIIQAERRFFCRLDKIENNVYKFWFTHK